MPRPLPLFYLMMFVMTPLLFKAQTFAWQKDRPLTYADFQGKVPSRRGMEAAVTASGIQSSAGFQGNKVSLSVGSSFDPAKSWMAPEARTPYILNHEQRHFDITEIFTRRMRQRMTAEIRTPEEMKRKYRPIWNEVYGQYDRFQKEYDAQTRHGLNKEMQEKYNQLIDAMLKETESVIK